MLSCNNDVALRPRSSAAARLALTDWFAPPRRPRRSVRRATVPHVNTTRECRSVCDARLTEGESGPARVDVEARDSHRALPTIRALSVSGLGERTAVLPAGTERQGERSRRREAQIDAGERKAETGRKPFGTLSCCRWAAAYPRSFMLINPPPSGWREATAWKNPTPSR